MKRFIILITLLIIGGASACTQSAESNYSSEPTIETINTEFDSDDGLVSEAEYSLIETSLNNAGYELYWTPGMTQILSEASCRIAAEVSNLGELADRIGAITQQEDANLIEMSFSVGVVMGTTCFAELERLTAAS